MTVLIYNALKTPDGTVIESTHRHDYKTYKDANGKTYMVDGGDCYLKRSAHGDEVDMSLYDDAPHEKQREVLTWGTYGINGDQPLYRMPIKEMEEAHINAVLQNCRPTQVLANCMSKELIFRETK